MSLLVLHHIVGYLSESVQLKIAEAAQAAREAARQGHSKRVLSWYTTYIRDCGEENNSEVGGCEEFGNC
jgi:hypothetical protein